MVQVSINHDKSTGPSNHSFFECKSESPDSVSNSRPDDTPQSGNCSAVGELIPSIHEHTTGGSHQRGEEASNTSTQEPSDMEGDLQWSQLRVTAEDEVLEIRTLSYEERLLAFADLYGRKPPGALETDQHLEKFERELSLLPIKQKSALHKGYTVKQARLFLSIENNDARRAVKRMARYWKNRFRALGDEAYADHYMGDRTQEDFRRVYDMALKAMMDPEVNEETKRWANKFSIEWKKAHLLHLDDLLAEVPANKKAALVEAQKARPDIAASDDHKWTFLRCEDYDAKRASKRMVKYWEVKFDLFGREGALRSVTVNDMMRDHPNEMSFGCYLNLRCKDRFGRSIVYLDPGKVFSSLMSEHGCTEEGVLKVLWYLGHVVAEEENASHENGVIYLLNDKKTNFSFAKRNIVSKFAAIHLESLPLNIRAFHIFPPPDLWFLQIFLPFAKWMMGKRIRMRLWVHTLSEAQSVSELEECGISRDAIPTALGGNLDTARLESAWLEERKLRGL